LEFSLSPLVYFRIPSKAHSLSPAKSPSRFV
jgi:hypothetical protein